MNKTVNIIQRDVNDLQSGQNNLQNDISDIKTILQKQGKWIMGKLGLISLKCDKQTMLQDCN